MVNHKYENPPGRALSVEFNLVENAHAGKDQFKAELKLTNNSLVTLGKNWTIYFNFVRMILPDSHPAPFRIRHINGDFFCLQPADNYLPIAPGTSLTVAFTGQYWVTKTIDKPVGFYIVYTDLEGQELKPEIIARVSATPFIRQAQLVRTANDVLPIPTAASRFFQQEKTFLLPKETLTPILPSPLFCQKSAGFYLLTSQNQIVCKEILNAEAGLLNEILAARIGKPLEIVREDKGDIRLILDEISVEGGNKTGQKEAYSLVIDNTGVEIKGKSLAGLFYGIQSLRMLFEPIEDQSGHTFLKLPLIEIRDAPTFVYRGMHLDVARNFQPVKSILKLLDLMAMYKLNTFHFHLTDDEGWRLEIPGLPELTTIGSRRGHPTPAMDCLLPSFGSGPDPNDPQSPGNGYYSREEFLVILQYAYRRHIRVIPEIDLPGHARAAIKAMEARYRHFRSLGDMAQATEYSLTDWEDHSTYESVQMWHDNVVDIGLESTFHFIEKVVDEIIEMYREVNISLEGIHIGGDEVPKGVWASSPSCQKLKTKYPDLENSQDYTGYFLKRVTQLLKSKGLFTAGWEETVLISKGDKHVPNPAFVHLGLIPYVWNTIWGWGGEAVAYELANAGYEVVLANATHLYFDIAYDKDPEEPGYYWAGYLDTASVFKFLPYNIYKSAEKNLMGHTIDATTYYKEATRLTDEGRLNILGLQGHLWGETIRDTARLEYQLFPRLLALAERAWSKMPAWANIDEPVGFNRTYNHDWNEFANRIGQIELPRLDTLHDGILYRIPMPGGIVVDGILYVNIEFPGMEIRFTTDGSEPSLESARFEKPVAVSGSQIKLKAFTSTGRSSRTSVI